jgi:delta-aminolevulinic acid dehydratase/porphobilinogen synthase
VKVFKKVNAVVEGKAGVQVILPSIMMDEKTFGITGLIYR